MKKNIKLYSLSDRIMCFSCVYFSILSLICKLLQVGHFHQLRHLRKSLMITFPIDFSGEWVFKVCGQKSSLRNS